MPEAIGAAMLISGIVISGLFAYPLVGALLEAILLRALADSPDRQEDPPPTVLQIPFGRLILCCFVKSLVTAISFIGLAIFMYSDGGLGLENTAALVGTVIALGCSIAIGLAPFEALVKRFVAPSDVELKSLTRRAALLTPLSIVLATILGVGLAMFLGSKG